MDTWQEHLSLGLLIEIPVLFLFFFKLGWFNNINSIMIIIPIAIISPLVMDLDHKQGKLRDKLTDLGMIVSSIAVILWYISTKIQFKLNGFEFYIVFIILITTASRFVFYFSHHRCFLHSIPFCFVYGTILYLLTFDIQATIIGLIGSYTHLLGDKIPFKMH